MIFVNRNGLGSNFLDDLDAGPLKKNNFFAACLSSAQNCRDAFYKRVYKFTLECISPLTLKFSFWYVYLTAFFAETILELQKILEKLSGSTLIICCNDYITKHTRNYYNKHFKQNGDHMTLLQFYIVNKSQFETKFFLLQQDFECLPLHKIPDCLQVRHLYIVYKTEQICQSV